ncbi:putative phage protein (TIGR02218 family) [Rhodovulum iodosum]|uniref:Phage protein (TIGR02218 family) n=1 Tax=Rhodovulum iodosum TaxID=68291 RepID=A0ABV3XVB6_9RHOB|nr:DUF2163 domain-containing protein [Rhodovulum robiginosum]RSK33541.1 DUF2163 domain-containing protein [Rhodovulum robiginosum]
MSVPEGLQAHLETGATTLCRAWAVTRRDGVVLGFTDHDRDLRFGGVLFRAESGLTARALSQTTGLSVDNTEAVGALTAEALREEEIAAGRYDGAEVRAWLVNWADSDQRVEQFRGTLGEITRRGAAFQAELRGLAEALNQVQGRAYQRPCSAVLGDGRCRVDLSAPGYSSERMAEEVAGAQVFRFAGFAGFSPRFFEAGRLRVLSGAAQGLVGLIKNDRVDGAARVVELWQALGAEVVPGDMLRLEAGCDKRAETCRVKFCNFINFQGFPHLPGEDWLMVYPVSDGTNDGGSRRA